MSWENSKDGSKFIKFEAGKSIEGNFVEMVERDNPFGEGKMYDYYIDFNGIIKILSSTSPHLKRELENLPIGLKVKVDMIQKGGKKMYSVYTWKEE